MFIRIIHRTNIYKIKPNEVLLSFNYLKLPNIEEKNNTEVCEIPLIYDDYSNTWKIQFSRFNEDCILTNYSECPCLALPITNTMMNSYHTKKTGKIIIRGGDSVIIKKINLNIIKFYKISYGMSLIS